MDTSDLKMSKILFKDLATSIKGSAGEVLYYVIFNVKFEKVSESKDTVVLKLIGKV